MTEKSNQQLLIVEDSSTQAAYLQSVLESSGFKVDWAKDGQAALHMLEKMSYKMVLSDIEMPGINGYELCKKIKSSDHWVNTPVILLTNLKDPKNIILGLEAGADSFFTKPFDAKTIVRRIDQLLYNRELRGSGKLKVGVELMLFGKLITITSEKDQILDLLISSFEDIITANSKLERSQEELASANRKIEDYANILENRVQTTEERYRTVFEHLAEGILICDNSGTVLTHNPAVLEIFGCSGDEIVNRKITDLVPEVRKHLAPSFGQQTKREPLEVQSTGLDGNQIHLSISVSKIENKDTAEYACLIRDRTTEKHTEQRLRQTEKMEAVGQLTGGIAHDYNNQLTVIAGAVEELQESCVLEQEPKQLVELISSAAKAGALLTNRLLAFSRNQPIDPEVVNIEERLELVKALLISLAGSNVNIKFVFPEQKTWPVKIDVSQFENAMLNLCINARDAMPAGGDIVVRVENRVVGDSADTRAGGLSSGDYVRVSFSDTGFGIPEHIIHKIMEPFFTTKEVGKGTGMGLAMVYGFVKKAGGELKVYSEMDVGSTFSLFLPREGGASLARGDAIPSVQTRKNALHVLLAEEEELVRKLTSKQLTSLGHQVSQVSNFGEAKQKLVMGEEFDLFIFNLNESKSESEIEAAWVAQPSLRVLITSSGYESDWRRCEGSAKRMAFLGKPYNRAQLASAIEKLIYAKEDR